MLKMFRSIKVIGLLAILAAALVWIPEAKAQQGYLDEASVIIDINQGSGRKFNIAVADLVPLSGRTDQNATYLPARLGANLAMTGLFNTLDKRSFMEANAHSGVDGSAVDFSSWTTIGADFLIKGGMEPRTTTSATTEPPAIRG